MTVNEKSRLLDHLIESGLQPEKMMSGTGGYVSSESIELTKRAVKAGCGVLMIPPYYFKGGGDEDRYRSFASIIDGVASDRRRMYLHHIPPGSQIFISLALIERFLKNDPTAIAGVKDSSGDCGSYA